jgi:phosphoglucosamine mutase
VRGRANQELTPELAMALGQAAATRLPPGSRVLIGRDPRVSGPMLEAAAVAGLTAAGAEAVSLGIAPTPAVAALVPMLGAAAGLVISASHNPPEYNGLKLLDQFGRKWLASDEDLVETLVASREFRRAAPKAVGAWRQWPEALERYRSHLVAGFAGRIPPLKAVLDLGHGAASTTAAAVLERLGVECVVLYGEPHGQLINQGCGATHPEVVADAVVQHGADIGLTFDGDADRLMVADETGRVWNGDAIMFVLARAMAARGELPGRKVVATVMSNLGLERALAREGIELVRTQVGDRWVAEEMARLGAELGGEQSGHVILSRWAVTGDGLLTALALMAELRAGQPVSRAIAGFETYPQILRNVRLHATGVAWESIPGLAEEVRACRADLGDEGRVFIRPSGTEPLLRIMLEGRDADHIKDWADRLVKVVHEALTPEAAPFAD